MKNYRIIGLMSGTSLDGLDIVDVSFSLDENQKYQFQINHAQTFPYAEKIQDEIRNGFYFSGLELQNLNTKLGRFFGEKVNIFLQENNVDKSAIDAISSHGQTIFHQPENGFTTQLGNGPELAVVTGLPTVVDFRTKDVALGGNGAPLIPVADFLLFQEKADSFLNLGGFSNFSYQEEGNVYSYDVCPVNIITNLWMANVNKKFDENGNMGKKGKVNEVLFDFLNKMPYYAQNPPKSLGWEDVEHWFEIVYAVEKELKNRLRTFYEHVAYQLSQAFGKANVNSVFVTGGGAKNTFLMKRIEALSSAKIIVPDEEVIDFKEAIGFAFMGMLRLENKINVWKTVTGAKRDSCSGVVMYP